MKVLKKITLFVLLCVSARADITLGTPVSLTAAAICPSGVCSLGNYTVPAVAPNQKLLLGLNYRLTASESGAGVATCTVGGVSATPIDETGSHTVADKERHFYILAADLPAPGAQAVVCTDDGGDALMRSANLTVVMLSGAAQAAAEASADNFCNSCTSINLNLTGVTPGAAIFWGVTMGTNTADSITPTPSIDVTTDARRHVSLEVIEATGGSVTVSPSWTTSTSSKTGVSSSHAPAPDAPAGFIMKIL